jgi:hypothetical protein
MKFGIRKISSWSRILSHIAFWLICTLGLTLAYSADLPNLWVSFRVILLFMPGYMVFFYTSAYWIIPKYLYQKKYFSLAIAAICCICLNTLSFRIIEITLADPFIHKIMSAADGPMVWSKIEGTFWEQLTKPKWMTYAFEQSNTLIWMALFIKFFKMWYERKQAAVVAELNFLKGQIHPHFLFNTLNNLYALTLKQSPQSPDVVLGLSNILRYMLYECDIESVLLKRDVEILQNYVKLEKIRYEERLDLNFSISGRLDHHRIPPLLMLPLVENAFKHGASETIDEAWINIDLQIKAHKLKFKVSNSKPVTQPENRIKHFGKIGLSNVKKRLEILYPGAHKLTVFDEEEIFVAILEIDLNIVH